MNDKIADGSAGKHPADLPAYVAGTLEAYAVRAVEAHLASCPECKEEAGALASMRDALLWSSREDQVTEKRPIAAGRRGPWQAAFLGGAAAAVLLAVVGLAVWRAAAPPLVRSIPSTLLAPPQRSDEPLPELHGTGPWAVTVLLPYTARQGAYRVRVERGGTLLGESTALSDAEGRITLLLQELAGPGRYELALEPVEAKRDETQIDPYPFSVTAPVEH